MPTQGLKFAKRRGAVVSALTAFALFALAGSAAAATVTTTEDGGPGSLRQAIADAVPGETITVPGGTYVLTQGELQIGADLTIAGAGAETTKISAAKSSRVFNIVGAEAVTISGLTLTEGKTGFEGAGIRAANMGELALRNDVISGNLVQATGPGKPGGTVFGSGVAFTGERLTITDSSVSGNAAFADGSSGTPGGEIFGSGVFAEANFVSIARSTFDGNTASARGGSGPSSEAQDGGFVTGVGLELFPAEQARIVDSTISNNVGDARGGPGGRGGVARAGGIAMFSREGAKSTLASTTIADNVLRAGDGVASGGGAALFASTASPLQVIDSTIASNTIDGGTEPNEIGFITAGGNLLGRGIRTVELTNTIVAGGVGPEGSENCGTNTVQEEGEIPFVSGGFNLDESQQCGNPVESDVVKQDALLGPLQDNGGPTETMLPGADSPALDQGTASGLKLDQRGLARTVDLAGVPNSTAPGADGTDIGAVEVQASK